MVSIRVQADPTIERLSYSHVHYIQVDGHVRLLVFIHWWNHLPFLLLLIYLMTIIVESDQPRNLTTGAEDADVDIIEMAVDDNTTVEQVSWRLSWSSSIVIIFAIANSMRGLQFLEWYSVIVRIPNIDAHNKDRFCILSFLVGPLSRCSAVFWFSYVYVSRWMILFVRGLKISQGIHMVRYLSKIIFTNVVLKTLWNLAKLFRR